MTNLTTQSSLLQFIKEELTNGTNLSIRGLARLCGVDDKSIINGADFKSAKLGQVLTAHRFEAADLSTNGFPPQAVWLTIEYFAYDSKAKAPQAKQLARTFGQIGIMTTFEKLTQIPEPVPAVKELPYHSYLKDLEAMMILAPEDEVLRQLVREKMIDEMSNQYGNKPALSASPELKEYTIAKVRATELGYTMSQIGSGSALGRYVGKRVESAYKQQVGRYPVKHYEINDELDSTIHNYFKGK